MGKVKEYFDILIEPLNLCGTRSIFSVDQKAYRTWTSAGATDGLELDLDSASDGTDSLEIDCNWFDSEILLPIPERIKTVPDDIDWNQLWEDYKKRKDIERKRAGSWNGDESDIPHDCRDYLKEYQGFTDAYKYCERCGKKESDL